MTVTSVGASLTPNQQNSGWSGNFAPGTALLWTASAGPDITLTFAQPVYGAGAQIQADYFGAFTAEVIVNGTQHFTETGNSTSAGDNSAIFIGWSGG